MSKTKKLKETKLFKVEGVSNEITGLVNYMKSRDLTRGETVFVLRSVLDFYNDERALDMVLKHGLELPMQTHSPD